MTPPRDPDWDQDLDLSKRFWVGCMAMLLSFAFLVASIFVTFGTPPETTDWSIHRAWVIDARESGTATEPQYQITYQFVYGGEELTQTSIVTAQLFSELPVGAKWWIRVAHKDPTRVQLDRPYPQTPPNPYPLVAFLFAIAGAVFALSKGNLAALKSRFS